MLVILSLSQTDYHQAQRSTQRNLQNFYECLQCASVTGRWCMRMCPLGMRRSCRVPGLKTFMREPDLWRIFKDRPQSLAFVRRWMLTTRLKGWRTEPKIRVMMITVMIKRSCSKRSKRKREEEEEQKRERKKGKGDAGEEKEDNNNDDLNNKMNGKMRKEMK